MLTNHDLDRSSPLACLLVGQPTLRRKIKLGVLAALDQRIATRYHMPGMTLEETADYLRHHLQLAGRSDTLLAEDAVALLHQTSRGYPRAVNNLALQALLAAFAANKSIVDEASAPAPPSPKSRPSEHHAAKLTIKPRPASARRGFSHPQHPHQQRRLHAHAEWRATPGWDRAGRLGHDPPDQIVVGLVAVGVLQGQLGLADSTQPIQRLGRNEGRRPLMLEPLP